MTPRQRVLTAIRHQQPDRVPWHFTYTVPAQQKLEQHYGTTDLEAVLGNHLAKYRPRGPDAWQEVRPDYWRDEFGVVWNRTVDKDIGVVEVKEQFGRHLTFYGGMSVQRLLPFGTPAEVRDEALRLMEEIGAGGGFIIGPSHAMPGDIPVENMVAFIETVRGTADVAR